MSIPWARRAVPLTIAVVLALPLPAQALVTPSPGERSDVQASPEPAAANIIGQLPVTDELAPTSRVVVTYEQPGSAAQLRAGPRLEAVRGAAGGLPASFVRLTGSGAAVYDLGRKVNGPGTGILTRLARIPGVVSVEFDQWIPAATAVPNDPHATSQWGLLGPADGSAFGMDVLPAWEEADGAGVVVAVVDSGVVLTHPDLAGQTVPGYDMLDGDSDATDTGACAGSHGTLVAGPIVAIAGNGLGIFGGAPGAKVQPVRVSACGGGWSTVAADGLRWAAGGTVPDVPANPTPAAIVNASFGVPDAPFCLPEFAAAIADARGRGALVVVAAGNADVDAATMSPGNCDGVLNVGAIDSDGRRSSFSNYGPALGLSAPGSAIWTTTRPDGYGQAAGTSLAAPHVAAAAALVKAAHPGFGRDALELVLTASALPPAADAAETGCASRGCGAGIVNAGRATAQLAPAATPISGLVFASRAYPAPGQSFSVRALAVDGVAVAAAEVRIGAGSWSPMSAEDGAFGSSAEWVTANVSAPTSQGTHAICVRADDGPNGPGVAGCSEILVDAGPPAVTAPSLSAGSIGAGQAVTFSTSAGDPNGVTAAEYRIDGGPWIPMRPADDAWGGTTEATGSTVNERVAQLAVGADPCVVMDGGTVRCWGHNYYGSVGDGTWHNRSVPVELDLADVTQVSSGGGHACALLTDRTVRCWGWNANGEVGDGSRKHQASPVPVPGLTDVTAVAAGPNHSCALRTDTTVWCWGPALGLGDGSEPPTVRTTPGPVSGLSGVIGLNAGGSNFGSQCALLADGTVRCWGDNAHGSLGDGSTTHRWTPVTVSGLSGVERLSGMYPCATLVDGGEMCWGANWYDSLGQGTTDHQLVPVPLAVVPEMEAVASGQGHKCAIVPDRTVRCWGNNVDGQLGDGTQTSSTLPRQAVGLTDVADIQAGWDTSCALRGDGSVWCWGWNEHGQLGDGSTAVRLAPVKAVGLGALAEGAHSVCVRATDAAGRTSNGSSCSTLTILDGTPPTASVSRPAAIVGATSLWGVTFSEPISGLAAADFSLGGTAGDGCSVGAPAGSGSSYQVAVTCPNGGTLTVTLAPNAVTDTAGLSGPASPVTGASATVDRTGPTTKPPRGSLPSGTTVTDGSIPVDISWSATDAGAGVSHYQVRVRTDGGAWRTVVTKTTKTSHRLALSTGHTHRLSVRAVDKVGNVGAWADGARIQLTARQESHRSIGYAGTWRTISNTRLWAGGARSSTTAGSRASVTFTGRSMAIVATLRPDSGWIRIRVDGRLVAELDLHADTVRYRKVVWSRTWKSSAERTITIHVLESPGRTRMDLDAIVTGT